MWRRDTEREKVKDKEWVKVCVGVSVWMCVKEKEGKRFREKQVQEAKEEREYETKTCQQFSYGVQVLHSARQDVHTNTLTHEH